MDVDSDKFYRQGIYEAIIEGNKKKLRSLLKSEDVNVKAYLDGETYLIMATRRDDTRAVNILLDAGADLYTANDMGDMAIHFAAKYGDVSMMKIFIERGMNIDVVGECGTPLGCALMFDNIDVARLLIEHGADLSIPDELGETALSVLKRKNLTFLIK